MSKFNSQKTTLFKPPKITTLTKQQYQKYHKVRELHNWTFGDHTLLSKDQTKFILKTNILPQTDKHPFLTSHPEHYQQLPPVNYSSKSRSYIFPLLGQPLSSFKVEQRWGSCVKNWIQRCGSKENALIEVIRMTINNYENSNVGDILLDCYRVFNGQLTYMYDSWMNSPLQTIKNSIKNKSHLNLQDFYLSTSQLNFLSSFQKNKAKAPEIQKTLSNFCQKLCLLILNLGVPEIKSRNYQLCEYQYNQDNILEKIRFFKTKYSNGYLNELVEKLWMHQNMQISEIWKLFDSIKVPLLDNKSKKNSSSHFKKMKQNFGNSMAISCKNTHEKSIIFTKSKESSLSIKFKQNTFSKNKPYYVQSSLNKSKKNISSFFKEKKSKNQADTSFDVDKSAIFPQSGGNSQKLKLRDNYRSLYLDNSFHSKLTKNKEESFFSTKFTAEDCFNLKNILFQSINFHTEGRQCSNGEFAIMKILDYLGLNQHIPQNLYEESVIQAFEEISVMPDWIYQEYPNGALYFGQISNQVQNSDNEITRNGKGMYLFDSNDLYIGTWVNNAMHGQGVYIFKSGEQYRGDIQNGLKHGYGKFEYTDKRIYEGYWHHNNKFGMGTVYFPNNVKFYGIFQKGQITQGIFSKIVKSQIIKQPGCLENYNWVQDKLNKNMEPKIQSNSRLQKCLLTSYLTQTDQNGNKYIGQGYNNVREGFGILDSNQEIYEGSWKSGEQSGEGKLIVKGKFEIQGKWEDGMLVSMMI